MRLFFPLALSVTLIGCATTKTDIRNEAKISQYDPATMARVRLITENTITGGYVSGQTCATFFNSLRTKTHEEAGWQAAHVDSPGLYPFRATDTQNSVIGMPASEASKAINSSSRVFDEHVVLAGKPLSHRYIWEDRKCHASPRLSRSSLNPAKTMRWSFRS